MTNLGNENFYAAGWQVTNDDDPTSDPATQPEIPFLISPYSSKLSHTVLAGKDGAKDGYAIGNMGSLHDLIPVKVYPPNETINYDLLNGATIIATDSPTGKLMLAYDDPSLVSSSQKWMCGQGTVYTSLDEAASTTTDPVSSPCPLAAGFITSALGTNTLFFASFSVPQSSTASLVQKMGIDVDGYSLDGAHSFAMHPMTDSSLNVYGGFGVLDTNTPSGTRLALNNAAETDFDVYFGDITICMAVNDTASSPRWMQFGSNAIPTTSIGRLSDASTSAWATGEFNHGQLNLGAGLGQGTGIYLLGIRQYTEAITATECQRVGEFIQKTGKLPYWWRT